MSTSGCALPPTIQSSVEIMRGYVVTTADAMKQSAVMREISSSMQVSALDAFNEVGETRRIK